MAKRGLRRATPGPDRAKPRQGAGTGPADTRDQDRGACTMAHTSSETVPGRVRMRLARTARMTLAQPAIGAHDPRWPEHCRITGCLWSGA